MRMKKLAIGCLAGLGMSAAAGAATVPASGLNDALTGAKHEASLPFDKGFHPGEKGVVAVNTTGAGDSYAKAHPVLSLVEAATRRGEHAKLGGRIRSSLISLPLLPAAGILSGAILGAAPVWRGRMTVAGLAVSGPAAFILGLPFRLLGMAARGVAGAAIGAGFGIWEGLYGFFHGGIDWKNDSLAGNGHFLRDREE